MSIVKRVCVWQWVWLYHRNNHMSLVWLPKAYLCTNQAEIWCIITKLWVKIIDHAGCDLAIATPTGSYFAIKI